MTRRKLAMARAAWRWFVPYRRVVEHRLDMSAPGIEKDHRRFGYIQPRLKRWATRWLKRMGVHH